MSDPSAPPPPIHRLAAARCFVLIVGNARSGSTLLGGVLDGHPHAVVANESSSSYNLWRNLTKPDILRDVYDNASQMAAERRLSEGYRYQIGGSTASKDRVLVIGDKVWNPSLLLLHGDPGLLPSLEKRLGMPVKLVYAVRNPFDAIATMHRRSGAPIADRIRWYFMHCDAAAAVAHRLPPERFLESHHADLLAAPENELARLVDFVGLKWDESHLEAVRQMIFPKPRRTAVEVAWRSEEIAEIVRRTSEFPFLHRYLAESPELPGQLSDPAR
jgi:hypothetical protein